MSQVDSILVRQTIEDHEPIRDIYLNHILVAEGIDPYDAIVIQDLLEEQGRIHYDFNTRCFSTAD